VNVSEETIASYSYSMSPLIRLDSWSKEQNGVTHGSATSAHLTPYKNDYINDNLPSHATWMHRDQTGMPAKGIHR